MRLLPVIALAVAVTAGPPAFAEGCRPAAALERQLFETPVQPFLPTITPEASAPGWAIGPWGGFQVAAPGLGEVSVLRGAAAELDAACSLRVTWALAWNAGRVVSANRFKVAVTPQKPDPRPSVKYAATTFHVTPDKALQTGWLTVTEGSRSDRYRLDFPATAISVLPALHNDSLRLEVAGVRADGVLVYAEFSALKTP